MPVKEVGAQQEFRAFTQSQQGPVRIIGAGIDTAEICNLACPCCYRRKSNRRDGYILPEVASPIMRKVKANGGSEIYFLGAEPTMNPALPEILHEAVDLGFEFVLLISNGMKLADETYARKVLLPGVSLLMHRHTLDSDAVAQQIQENSVGRTGTLEKSHRAWRNALTIFKENGGKDRLMMQSCLTEAAMSGDNLDKVFKWAREELGTLPIMEYVSPPNTGHDDQLGWLRSYPLLTGKIVAQLERFMQIDKKLGLSVLRYKDAVSPQAYGTSCTMVCEGGQITKGGVYLPCTNMNPKSTNPAQYGNILLESFDSIERSPIRRAFLKPNFRKKGCDDPCVGSGCWWTGLVTTGCYRLCQLNCVFNEEKTTIDDVPELCDDCQLNQLREEGVLKCGPGTRPGLALGDGEKILFKA